MHQLVAKVWRFIQQESLLCENDKVILAVSGGADSTSMLHVICSIREKVWANGQIIVGHLDHQLRGAESDEDANFVRELCEKLGVPCIVESMDVRAVAETERENLEATARRLRYDFLRRIAIDNDAAKVATAHTMNDQAETLLLRLMRGSGAAGLGGIHPIRSLNPDNDRNQIPAVSLIRPFLCISRDEVIEYCKDNALEYRTDSSNFLVDYARNQIRHEIIHKLADLNPQVISVLSTTADRLRGDEQLLRQEAIERLKSFSFVGAGPMKFPVKLLIESPLPIRRRMLREMIAIVRGGLSRITMQHLIAAESLLKSGKSGKEVFIPGVHIQREFESLVLTKAGVDAGKLKRSDGYLHKLGTNEEVRIGLNNRELIINLIRTEKYVWENRSRFVALLDERQIELPLMVRPRRPGDRYVPVGANRPVKLKEIMIKNRIPLNERNIYPVIVTESDDLVWSPGMPVARKFAAIAETKNWVVISASFVENVDA